MTKVSVLYEELERTLSYFEKMSLEMIYIDLDSEFLKKFPHLSINDLSNTLVLMQKDKKIKVIKEDGHKYYLRIYPKKSILEKLRRYFSK